MKTKFLFITGAVLAATACQPEASGPKAGEVNTLRLEAGADGKLRHCANADYSAENADCHEYRNPGQCAVLEIRIDTGNGSTCETCFDSDGEVTSEGCDDTVIDCTTPDPDCVVCAHVDGATVFSSCTCGDTLCDAPPPECDPLTEELVTGYPYCCGQCMPKDRCRPDSPADQIVACPAVVCSPGYHPAAGPNCCEICVPNEGQCKVDEDCGVGAICDSGKCAIDDNACTETDGGMDPQVAGETKLKTGDGVTVLKDVCHDDKLLLEHFCLEPFPGSGLKMVSTDRIECQYGCAAGACNKGTSGD